MDFLVVTESKLKITMSLKDMEEYHINGDDIDYDNPKIRRAFWRILDKAREEVGFDVAGDKVLIQFYPAKDGCEIFVTKLGLISSSAERTISKSSRVAMLHTKRSIYKFTSFGDLISAIRIIEPDYLEKEPRVFFDEEENFYIMSERRMCSGKNSSEFSRLSEYGNEIPENLAPYIMEHSIEIDYNFVRKLA